MFDICGDTKGSQKPRGRRWVACWSLLILWTEADECCFCQCFPTLRSQSPGRQSLHGWLRSCAQPWTVAGPRGKVTQGIALDSLVWGRHRNFTKTTYMWEHNYPGGNQGAAGKQKWSPVYKKGHVHLLEQNDHFNGTKAREPFGLMAHLLLSNC